MIWWFLLLAVSAVVVVSVGLTIYMRVRRQLRSAQSQEIELDDPGKSPPRT